MSITFNCFEGLNIQRCNIGFCRPKKQVEGRVVLIHDKAIDLCVVSAPNRKLDTVGITSDEFNYPWDFMTIDKDLNLVMMTGVRFLELSLHAERYSQRADACKGEPIAEAFQRAAVDIFIPLLRSALLGNSPQLHTIYKAKTLTLFAFPFRNELKEVIGVHVIYRPTKMNPSEIATLLPGAT